MSTTTKAIEIETENLNVNAFEIFKLLYDNPAVAKAQSSTKTRQYGAIKENGYLIERIYMKEALEKIIDPKSSSKDSIKEKVRKILADFDGVCNKYTKPLVEEAKISPFQYKDYMEQFITIMENDKELEDKFDDLDELYNKVAKKI